MGVTELKPKRNAVHAIFNIEDAARLGGLEEALRRDLSAALVDGIDKAIFVGDTGATGTDSDITGLTGASIRRGTTLTQANKVKGDEVLKLFAAMIDGQYAGGVADLNTVLSVGANVLWMGHGPADVRPLPARPSLSSFAAPVSTGAFAAASTRTPPPATTGRSLAGPVESTGRAWAPYGRLAILVRDEFTGADKGEVQLTLIVSSGTSRFRGLPTSAVSSS